MKTIRDWLNELPDGYRERALAQMEHSAADEEEGSLHEAVLGFATWIHTEEGHEFWKAVMKHDKYRDSPLPPLPEEKGK